MSRNKLVSPEVLAFDCPTTRESSMRSWLLASWEAQCTWK